MVNHSMNERCATLLQEHSTLHAELDALRDKHDALTAGYQVLTMGNAYFPIGYNSIFPEHDPLQSISEDGWNYI